jgi:hypothetical protein
MLQEDKVMQDIILARIREVEEGKARNKLVELEEMDRISMEKAIHLKELEFKEHEFLDTFLDDGDVLVVGDSLVVETSTDWEQLELESLENVLEYGEKDSIAKEKNLQTEMMKTYLHNTDLLSKRMVGARILEPNSSVSELTWPNDLNWKVIIWM